MSSTSVTSTNKREVDTEISQTSEQEPKRVRLDTGTWVVGDMPSVLAPPGSSSPEKGHEVEAEGVATSQSKFQGRPSGKDAAKKTKRGGRRGTRAKAVSSVGEGGEEVEKGPRLPKRLCALLIGYSGSGYNGMQIQKDVRTIEGVLFQALIAARAVSADNADDPVKVGLQRAARTDAGVHAAGNVVSMKIITTVPGVPNLVERINQELPPEIRLWTFVRVQNSFNARMSCDSRKYTYYFPSYLLIPPKPGSGLHRTFAQQSTLLASSASPELGPSTSDVVPSEAPATEIPSHPFWTDSNFDTSREQDVARKKLWRVGSESIAALREAAKRYEGTHNFHNFTVGRDFKDRSCHRFMKTIEVADPVVYNGTEWINVMLHGQSFMLHQIRKMMCVLVMAVRTGTPTSVIDELYGPRSVTIPKMPSLGLLLEQPIFESYNKRVSDMNSSKDLQTDNVDFRFPIDFDAHSDTIRAFKDEHIYSRMRENEERVEVFDRWITQFDRYAGADLLYYNAKGIVPDAAVVRKGERRANSFREKRRFDKTEFAPEEAIVEDDNDADEMEVDKEAETISKKELEEAEG